MAAHKHAALIKQWADGAEVEWKEPTGRMWKPLDTTATWDEGMEYRIKPAEPERVYPVTRMSEAAMCSAYFNGANMRGPAAEREAFKRIANAALRHAVDNGQVVTKEEYEEITAHVVRAFQDRRDVRDMNIAEATAKAVYNIVYTFGAPKRAFCDLGIDYAEIISKVP